MPKVGDVILVTNLPNRNRKYVKTKVLRHKGKRLMGVQIWNKRRVVHLHQIHKYYDKPSQEENNDNQDKLWWTDEK